MDSIGFDLWVFEGHEAVPGSRLMSNSKKALFDLAPSTLSFEDKHSVFGDGNRTLRGVPIAS
jgi:hypothetical protein